MSKKTRIEYIKEAMNVHGNLYKYNRFVYTGSKSKSIITCRIHGDFKQRWYNHINGSGCPKCAGVYKKSTKEAIDECNKVHNYLYDYPNMIYINSTSNIDITCKTHGDFNQKYSTHISGSGCKKCSKIRKTTKQAVDESIRVHGNLYNYNRFVYTGAKNKVIVNCKIHGDFKQRYSTHISGSGCKKCSRVKKTTKIAIDESKRVHGNLYNYSKFIYTNGKSRSIITCRIHGDFKQIVDNHINLLHGCPKCGGVSKPTTKEVISQFMNTHGNLYDYSKFEYVNNKTKGIIICKKHGDFKQNSGNHLRGQGCPRCSSSLGENRINKILNDFNIENKPQFGFENCRRIHKLPFDFYLLKYNLCIEYDGIQHFEPVKRFGGESEFIKRKINDEIKNRYCRDNNIKLLRIPYWDFKNIESILMSELK